MIIDRPGRRVVVVASREKTSKRVKSIKKEQYKYIHSAIIIIIIIIIR